MDEDDDISIIMDDIFDHEEIEQYMVEFATSLERIEFDEVMGTTTHQELDDILEEALRGEDVVMEESGMIMNVSVMSWSEEEDNFDDWVKQELITMKFPLHILTSECSSAMILDLGEIYSTYKQDTTDTVQYTPLNVHTVHLREERCQAQDTQLTVHKVKTQ